MKKIFYVAISATLLAAGCQKTEILNQPVGEDLTFSAQMGKLTKADATVTDELKTQKIDVWAIAAYEDDLNKVTPGTAYKEIKGIELSFATDGWSTQKEYYWPGKQRYLDFFAISTGTTENKDIKDLVSVFSAGDGKTARTMTVTDYHVIPATTVEGVSSGASDDLMVADFVHQSQEMNSKAVKLNFRHALSKVQFKFKTTQVKDKEGTLITTDKVTLHSIKVTGLTTKGTLNVSESTKEEDASTGVKQINLEWDENTFKTRENFEKKEDKPLNSNYELYATWLVIPQSIESLQVVVEYTIEGRDKQTFTHNFALKGETGTGESKKTVAKWDVNQVTTYNIDLSPNRISFSPEVTPWDPETPINSAN